MSERFSVPDYIVFSVMMAISACIGIWFGCGPGQRQKTTKEYLLADGQMKTLPVAISLLVSFLSAITLLGVPSEIYTYGAQYSIVVFAYFFVCGVSALVFVPMFHRLKIVCVNEYLERRFSTGIRFLGCSYTLTAAILYLFVVLYAPSLALEAVAGLPLYVSILVTGIICTFYTALGGLKAVIWTDVFQAGVMLTGLIMVVVVGSMEVGGMGEVFRINNQFGRLVFFDFDPDPTVRNTFWTITIGTFITTIPVWTVFQQAVQRFLAIKKLRDAQKAMLLNIPGLTLVLSICILDGLVIFAVYANCDLRSDGKITSNDQALPYFVVNKLGYMKGVPGLFTACLYAGALSTISSVLNAMSTIILEDVLKKKIRNLSDEEAAKICKIIAVVCGVITMGGAFFMKYTGTLVLQLSFSVTGIFGGSYFGLFTVGMFVPRANKKGVSVGAIAGAALCSWVFFGSVFYPPNKNNPDISIRGCSSFNESDSSISGIIKNKWTPHSDPLAKLYGISYLWIGGLSFLTCFVVGVIASLILETKEDKEREIDPVLLFPVKEWLLSWLPGRTFTWERDDSDDEAHENDERILTPNGNAGTSGKECVGDKQSEALVLQESGV